jgi:Na+/proline symporter
MILHKIDWIIIFSFFLISLIIGIIVSKKAGKNSEEFFVSGRSMPWWLLGVSMVATTFSTDTPNLVADMVRTHGVFGNWLWWAFLITGMVTVFIYAKLWRRSNVLTDIEFYELRYSGKNAAFLRWFRAIYLGVFFNVAIMATVSLAAIKIGGVMFGFSPVKTILIASTIVVIYSMLGGLRGVLITDLFQFAIAMFGAVAVAVVAVNLPQVGGLTKLLANKNVIGKLSILPDFSNTKTLISIFIIPIAVQWWSVWYPGAEPGGGGYIVQRMLAAKDEKHAVGATFFFNIAHYGLRPWPWIIVALASLVVFPDIASLSKAFPHIASNIMKNDLAYPAMLTFLPIGLLGLVVASLIAAYMSTISTHLNWGSSYIVNDFYKRFIKKDASEKELVFIGRLSTLILMIIAGSLALFLQNALQAFHILLQIGAGTGLIFLLRWFWWRINAASEIAAMVISFFVAVYFELIHNRIGMPHLDDWEKLIIGVLITTVGWLSVALLTKPTDMEKLKNFYRKVYPGGPGWKKVYKELKGEKISGEWDVPYNIINLMLGIIIVYSTIFSTGYWIYGNIFPALVSTGMMIISSLFLIKRWKRLKLK